MVVSRCAESLIAEPTRELHRRPRPHRRDGLDHPLGVDAESRATYGATKLATQEDRRPTNATPELEELAILGAALLGRLNAVPTESAPLTMTETAAAKRLGVSAGFFKSYVLPELRVIRRGARVLIPLSELERWIDRSAARTVER